MKKILFIMILFSPLMSCKNSEPIDNHTDHTNITSVNFDWLQGDWERANEEAGKQTREQWTKITNIEYLGFGYTLQDQDTIWKENIRLINRDSIWNFEVTGQGEDHPTIFRLTHIEKERFNSENQENDFPKIITYSRDGNKLKAVISGKGMEIPFEFIPVNRN